MIQLQGKLPCTVAFELVTAGGGILPHVLQARRKAQFLESLE
jgi:hypothetical protein